MRDLHALSAQITVVRSICPLVHNITNYVTVNDCANMLLACGASPIMADDALEVEEITTLCQSLVLNIGTLNARTVESMLLAGIKANDLGHPVILDPVGVGASKLRTQTVQKLLAAIDFTVIKGNISEIKALALGHDSTRGVDAAHDDALTSDNLEQAVTWAQTLALKTNAVIVITGPVDIVVDREQAYLIRNGHPLMSRITGTGCMLGATIGAFVGANTAEPLTATAAAVSAVGICGESAARIVNEQQLGTGSFKRFLLDAMSQLDAIRFEAGVSIERHR